MEQIGNTYKWQYGEAVASIVVTRLTKHNVFFTFQWTSIPENADSNIFHNEVMNHRETIAAFAELKVKRGIEPLCDCEYPNEESETRLISETCHEHNYNPKPLHLFI